MFTRRAVSAMGLMAFAPLARAQTPAPTIKVGTIKMASLTNACEALCGGALRGIVCPRKAIRLATCPMHA
jgi:hypothetical protein